jgi:hypothetical protein
MERLVLPSRGVISWIDQSGSVRTIVVALLIAMHLLSGALHQLYESDRIDSVALTTVMASSFVEGSGESGEIATVARHCHGCFSVSLPTPPMEQLLVVRLKAAEPLHQSPSLGLSLSVDPPLPKQIT